MREDILHGNKCRRELLICGKMKNKFNLDYACYHSFQIALSYSLLSRDIKVKIYKNVFLFLVLCGCGTWPLIRKHRRLTVFENRVPRRTFEPKGGEVIAGWRKLHNEELHNLYSSPAKYN
jgi:hypothetical protein